MSERCEWYAGCELDAMPDGNLCDFHEDAVERREHYERQLAHEALRSVESAGMCYDTSEEEAA